MKQLFFVLLTITCCIIGYPQNSANESFNLLNPADQEMLTNAIGLVDGGMSEAAMADFDFLAKKYPDNYIVQYERLYNLYTLGRFKEVVKGGKRLLKHKHAAENVFQMVGNAYDITGDRKKAAKTYLKGLELFPKSGSLYLELGNLSVSDKDYNKALEYYNLGIVVQPDFASNYYRAAQLYLSSTDGKVWGLVYAEAAFLLAPSNESRHNDIANMITKCLKENIHLSEADGKQKLSVTLSPARNVKIAPKTKQVYMAFPGIYEGAILKPLIQLAVTHTIFTGNLAQLTEIRKGAVEAYYTATDNVYGNSMYLLEFQKKIIDAGHWEAYNYYLFMPAFPEEFTEWYDTHSDSFEAFATWYNNAPFTLGDDQSVSCLIISNDHTAVDLTTWLSIASKLSVDSEISGQ